MNEQLIEVIRLLVELETFQVQPNEGYTESIGRQQALRAKLRDAWAKLQHVKA